MAKARRQQIPTVQRHACTELPKGDPFRALRQKCHACRSVGANEVRSSIDEHCAFKDRRMLVDGQVTFCSGETEDPKYPETWTGNRLTPWECMRLKAQIADILLPLLEAELEYVQDGPIIWFRRELMVRTVCDSCRTTLFALCAMCTECGHEWCHLCREDGRAQCTDHSTKIMKVSRFRDETEIEGEMNAMKTLLAKRAPPGTPSEHQINREVKVLPADTQDKSTWTDHLRRGVPLMFESSHLAMQRPYDPQYFSSRLQDHDINIVHAITGTDRTRNAGDVFRTIGSRKGKDFRWKLKDFPPEAAIDAVMRPLSAQLDQGWPLIIAAYVTARSPLNCMSYWPENEGVPKSDIGPKLYCSPGIPSKFNKASTALHTDMTDAVNISLWGDPTDQEENNIAEWYIFPAHGCDAIRSYLDDKYGPPAKGDHIHNGDVFFTSEMVKELEERKGIKPWIIYQSPGQTVFIPARCPHQVRNLRWTFKAAIDFVSGYSLRRTAKVAEELRKQRFSANGLEDVLQLNLVLWHAWKVLEAETETLEQMYSSEKVASGVKRTGVARRRSKSSKKAKVVNASLS